MLHEHSITLDSQHAENNIGNYTKDMAIKNNWLLPAFLLGIMFLLMLGTSLGDSLTTDEQAHIPAGYSYVKLLDYRLNPEHPPLVKALAGLPLLFLHLNFPTNAKSWADDVNGQWDQGTKFIFESGNDPAKIIFWARLPMMLLTLFFGALFFIWSERKFGKRAALMALALFSFSPNFIAHGHLVTTDIGATLGFLIGIGAFLNFLHAPNSKHIAIAGIALGIALLLKFSTFLLLPIYAALVIFWLLTRNSLSWKERHRLGHILLLKSIAIGIIALIVISLVYGVFMVHYPVARQISDSNFILGSFGNRFLVKIHSSLLAHSPTRPLGHYFLGILMVLQRSAGGNTTYFLGNVSNAGSHFYFPIMYVTKEPLGFLILLALALGISVRQLWRVHQHWGIKRISQWIELNFARFALGFFIIFYWGYSMKSPLNIGVRHILPTFPFIYLLVSNQLIMWIRGVTNPSPQNWREVFSTLYRHYIAPIPRYTLLAALFIWIALDTLLIYPHFLSYYNELAGGPKEGYRIAVDSNYDWGQDLARLGNYLKENDISQISLEYFGGSQPSYYLGNTFIPWSSSKGAPHGYFAVSTTLLQGAWGTPYDFVRKPEDSYSWLRPYEPIARAGYSIFIYKLP